MIKMKQILSAVLSVALLAGVWAMPVSAAKLPKKLNMEFTSGAGGWSTEIKLNKDGSFKGTYHDSEMGDTGDGYPNGSMYYCTFSGKFKNIKKAGDYRYTMTLESLEVKDPENTEEVKDGIRWISAVPYGMEKGKEYVLFCPGFSIKKLPQNKAAKGWYKMYLYGQEGDYLESYLLYNKGPKYVFTSL